MIPRSCVTWRCRAARVSSLEAWQLVSQRDPQNPSAAAEAAAAYDDLAFILTYQDKTDDARDQFGQAIDLFSGLIEQYLVRDDWRRDLALVFKRRGDLGFQSEA